MRELELMLKDYRLTTAEILYHLPDHPSLLQTYVWQGLDIAPKFPVLHKFLAFLGKLAGWPPAQRQGGERQDHQAEPLSLRPRPAEPALTPAGRRSHSERRRRSRAAGFACR